MPSPVALTLNALLTLIGVENAGTCPSAPEIVAEQRRLLPPSGDEFVSPWRAHVEERADGMLHVRVSDEDGAERGEKVLPAEGTCAARAESLAVLLAAWESDLEAVSLAPSVSQLTVPEPPAVRRPLPVSGVPDVVPEPVPVFRSAALPIPERALSLFVSTAAGATSQQGGVYPTLEIAATLRGEGAPVGFQVGAWLSPSRAHALGPGAVSVREELVHASAVFTRARHSWRTELSVGGAVGWMHLGSTGFTQNRSMDGFRPGLTSGLWLSRRLGRSWLGAGFVGRAWLNRPRVSVEGVSPVLKLRAVDGTAALRLGWDF